MKPTLTHRSLIAALAVLLAALAAFAKDGAEGRTKDQHSKVSEPTEAPAILATMQSELDRSMAGYSKADPPVYFISYTIADREYAEVSGSNGALLSSTENHARWLEVQTRVGSIKQDNTHKLGDRQPSWTSPGTHDSCRRFARSLTRDLARNRQAIPRCVAGADQSENEPAGAGANG